MILPRRNVELRPGGGRQHRGHDQEGVPNGPVAAPPGRPHEYSLERLFRLLIILDRDIDIAAVDRQRDRYAREGVDLSLSTLADQVGACAVALRPLHDLIAAHVLAAERLHGDGTPVPVLARGKTATGRAWVYVRDDAPFGGADPPAALFRYSRDRSGDHPVEHLRGFAGILQADAYAGYAPYGDGRRRTALHGSESAHWLRSSVLRCRFYTHGQTSGLPSNTRGRSPVP